MYPLNRCISFEPCTITGTGGNLASTSKGATPPSHPQLYRGIAFRLNRIYTCAGNRSTCGEERGHDCRAEGLVSVDRVDDRYLEECINHHTKQHTYAVVTTNCLSINFDPPPLISCPNRRFRVAYMILTPPRCGPRRVLWCKVSFGRGGRL